MTSFLSWKRYESLLFVLAHRWYWTLMNRTVLGFAPIALALCMTLACGDDGDPSTTMDGTGETGDGDGDMTTTGDGDGDMTTTGDGDGDPATATDTDDPPVDTDEDGVADDDDNCPDDPNPNQLDYDDNGMGNVCDTQVFTMASGTLNTTASAEAFGQGCNIPLMVDVTGGQVRIQLDDDAAVAMFEISELQLADVPEQVCDLGLAAATVSMSNFVITNDGGDFPVMMAHDMGQHDNGQVAGDSDAPHPVIATALLSAAVGDDPPMDSDLMLEDASLPVFTANITDGGATGVLSWASPDHVVATTVFEVDVLGMMVPINFELAGMIGSVTLTP